MVRQEETKVNLPFSVSSGIIGRAQFPTSAFSCNNGF